MTTKTTLALVMALLAPLAACADSDSVLFVTKTSLGIDMDTKPAGVAIAYDRVEGYVGPTYDNGAMPPVVAFIESSGGLL
ncbi:MAG: hypothetical protein HQL41_18730, partial [Alphaproteobacteria bacterium]|nr:hypothetical protein [Alphaproteobacteria bacterium]